MPPKKRRDPQAIANRSPQAGPKKKKTRPEREREDENYKLGWNTSSVWLAYGLPYHANFLLV